MCISEEELKKFQDEVLDELKSMNDEELLEQLESCQDYSIAYALDHTLFDKPMQ